MNLLQQQACRLAARRGGAAAAACAVALVVEDGDVTAQAPGAVLHDGDEGTCLPFRQSSTTNLLPSR